MPQSISKKIFFYFFLLFMFGSINNLSLKNINFYTIKNIYVSGLDEDNNKKILNDVKNLKLRNIFLVSKNKIDKIINDNSLIEDYYIFKIYPSTIQINIKKTEFLAKINIDGKTFLLGSNAKLSKYNNNHLNYLPFIFGKPNSYEFLKLKKIIDNSKFSYEEIENLYFYPSKRWDLQFKDYILLKLPKNVTTTSLDNVFEFLKNKEIAKNSIVDIRVNNQIILNE
tara:strand:+ start:620 stop:1294 length:675 start_codon:yes stop_codon:yes gene_type:complete